MSAPRRKQKCSRCQAPKSEGCGCFDYPQPAKPHREAEARARRLEKASEAIGINHGRATGKRVL